MDYRYNGRLIEVKTSRENQKYRLLMYYRMLQALMHEKEEYNERYEKRKFMDIFWDKESKWEQKIYGKLKGWEERHPIMGIVFCTVLGGILVSLVAGVILEAILMCV